MAGINIDSWLRHQWIRWESQRWMPYALAVVSTLVATGARWALTPLLGGRAPFLLYLLGVVAVSRYGGLASGLTATGLGLIAVIDLIPSPWGHWGKPVEVLMLLLFTLVGVQMSIICEGLRRANVRALKDTEHIRSLLEQTELDRAEKVRLLTQVRESVERERVFFRDVLYSVTEGRLCLCSHPNELPPVEPQCHDSIPLSIDTLGDIRKATLAVATQLGMTDERCYDLMSAVSECAMNAFQHGNPNDAYGRVCSTAEKAQVWIQDGGNGIDLHQLPKATLLKGHSTKGSLGHGFYIILHTADVVYLLTDKTGTTVVIEQLREKPLPVFVRGMVEEEFT